MTIEFPGKLVGTEEEYVSDSGTYEDNGEIKATVMGKLNITESRHVKVIPFEQVPELKIGNVVYGRIEEIFEAVAFIDIEISGTDGKHRTLKVSGVIPVSEVKKEYVQSIREELKIGDIVRAQINKLTKFRVELTLKPMGMGVVKGFCKADRGELELKGETLVCSTCGRREQRRLGRPYGKF